MSGTIYGLKGVIASKSAVQSLTSGAEAVVTFDVETYDTSVPQETEMHSVSTNTGRFYAPEEGLYEVRANVKLAAVAAAGRVRMRYTLRPSTATTDTLWQWTYSRDMFFWAGVSPSRKAAIRALLEARREARDCAMTMEKRRATWPTAA